MPRPVITLIAQTRKGYEGSRGQPDSSLSGRSPGAHLQSNCGRQDLVPDRRSFGISTAAGSSLSISRTLRPLVGCDLQNGEGWVGSPPTILISSAVNPYNSYTRLSIWRSVA